MSYGVKDANVKKTKALPNGAAAATSDAIDLGHTNAGRLLADVEFLVSAPALGATPMPDGKTMIYAVVVSANSDLSSPTVLYDRLIVQTGAGGAGAAAATARFRLPTNVARYLGVRATGSASGDASGSTFTVEAMF